MDRLKVRFRKSLAGASAPSRSTSGAGAYDLSVAHYTVKPSYVEYNSGICVEIPDGYVGLLFMRSSVCNTRGHRMLNAVGVIDSDYRGEIKGRFEPRGQFYRQGDRFAQLAIVPAASVVWQECAELSETSRGGGGYGSTGH